MHNSPSHCFCKKWTDTRQKNGAEDIRQTPTLVTCLQLNVWTVLCKIPIKRIYPYVPPLFPPIQTTQRGQRCSLSVGCAWVSSSHSSPWWSRSPVALTASTANDHPSRSGHTLPTPRPTPATRTRTGTTPRTSPPGGTGDSSELLTWTYSRLPKSWRGHRGWRRENGSSGKSGWTDSLTSPGHGASTDITEDRGAVFEANTSLDSN